MFGSSFRRLFSRPSALTQRIGQISTQKSQKSTTSVINVVFVDMQGNERKVQGTVGESLLDVARTWDIDLEGMRSFISASTPSDMS